MRTSYINWSSSKYHHTPIGTMISRATNSNDVGLILQNWKIQFQQRVNDIFVPLWLRFNFDGTSIWLLLLCQNLHRNNKKPFELGHDLLCLCVFVFVFVWVFVFASQQQETIWNWPGSPMPLSMCILQRYLHIMTSHIHMHSC